MTATAIPNADRKRRPARPAPAVTPDELAARLEELAGTVAELAQQLNEQRSTDKQPSPDADRPPLYDNVEDWVRQYLLVNFSRPFGEVGAQRWHWCAQWWRHNEAVTALTALWYAWEHARLQPTGILSWLHELHYHLGVISGPDGPFRQCAQTDGDRPAKHTEDQFAHVVPAPPRWWHWWGDDA